MSLPGITILARLSQRHGMWVLPLWLVDNEVPNSMSQIGQCSIHISSSLSISVPGSLRSNRQPLHLVATELSLVLQPTFSHPEARGAGELVSHLWAQAVLIQQLTRELYKYPSSLITWMGYLRGVVLHCLPDSPIGLKLQVPIVITFLLKYIFIGFLSFPVSHLQINDLHLKFSFKICPRTQTKTIAHVTIALVGQKLDL